MFINNVIVYLYYWYYLLLLSLQEQFYNRSLAICYLRFDFSCLCKYFELVIWAKNFKQSPRPTPRVHHEKSGPLSPVPLPPQSPSLGVTAVTVSCALLEMACMSTGKCVCIYTALINIPRNAGRQASNWFALCFFHLNVLNSFISRLLQFYFLIGINGSTLISFFKVLFSTLFMEYNMHTEECAELLPFFKLVALSGI